MQGFSLGYLLHIEEQQTINPEDIVYLKLIDIIHFRLPVKPFPVFVNERIDLDSDYKKVSISYSFS